MTMLYKMHTKEDVFIAQPSDVVVKCGSNESAEFKCQHILGNEVRPVWIVNSTVYGHGYMDLPNHYHDDSGTVLSVKSIEPKHNNTVYQCQLEVQYHRKTSCTYTSTVGRLIIKGCGGKYNYNYYYIGGN